MNQDSQSPRWDAKANDKNQAARDTVSRFLFSTRFHLVEVRFVDRNLSVLDWTAVDAMDY